MAKNVEAKIKEIIEYKLGVGEERLVPQALLLNDLGADSLDDLEIIMAIEDEFDIEISDEDAEKIKTVEDAIKYVTERI
jgi:acyl carrier protein